MRDDRTLEQLSLVLTGPLVLFPAHPSTISLTSHATPSTWILPARQMYTTIAQGAARPSAGTPCDGDQNWAMYDSLPIDAPYPFTVIVSGTLIAFIVFDLALLDAVETLMGTVGLYLPGYDDPRSISMLNVVAASLPQSVVPHSGSS